MEQVSNQSTDFFFFTFSMDIFMVEIRATSWKFEKLVPSNCVGISKLYATSPARNSANDQVNFWRIVLGWHVWWDDGNTVVFLIFQCSWERCWEDQKVKWGRLELDRAEHALHMCCQWEEWMHIRAGRKLRKAKRSHSSFHLWEMPLVCMICALHFAEEEGE